MVVRPVNSQESESVVEALQNAFRGDPLIGYLFGAGWEQGPHVTEFFRILLGVRLTLGMPAYCAVEDGFVLGAVMGYDTTRPKWSVEHIARWESLMRQVEGLASRLAAYGELAEQFEPAQGHFYLGVIGVREGKQGAGVGRALLERFCDASELELESGGVYLETASDASLRFYLKNGFELRGEGVLGEGTSLWCVFRTTGLGAAA